MAIGEDTRTCFLRELTECATGSNHLARDADDALSVDENQFDTHSCARLGMLMIGFNSTFPTFLPKVAVFIE